MDYNATHSSGSGQQGTMFRSGPEFQWIQMIRNSTDPNISVTLTMDHGNGFKETFAYKKDTYTHKTVFKLPAVKKRTVRKPKKFVARRRLPEPATKKSYSSKRSY